MGGAKLRTLSVVSVSLFLACSVDVDTRREGFPCNPDGGCQNGLVCVDGSCVVDLGGGADGGAPDCSVPTPAPVYLEPTGTITLTAVPDALPADGVSISRIATDPIVDGRGVLVADGTVIRLSTDLGTLLDGAGTNGTQIDVSTLGGIGRTSGVSGAPRGQKFT